MNSEETISAGLRNLTSFQWVSWRYSGELDSFRWNTIKSQDFIVFMFQWSHTKCHWQIADSNYPQHRWLRTLAICHLVKAGWPSKTGIIPDIRTHGQLIQGSPRPYLTNVSCGAILSHAGVVSSFGDQEISISVILVFRIKVTTWNRVI